MSDTSIKEMIKSAKLPERSATICLDRSLNREMEVLERQLADLARRPSTASFEGDPATAIAHQIVALQDRMAKHTVEFWFRALPRTKYTTLVKAHPPRKDDEIDEGNGFNVDTFFAALARVCCYEPQLDVEDWDNLFGRDPDPAVAGDEGVDPILSSAQYDTIVNTAWAANRRDVDVPFSQAASRHLRTSAPA